MLSTWYVRRSRRRFYGEGWPVDKRTAYSTLYNVLNTLNRLFAPIVPFMAEKIYQNLVAARIEDAPSSVHHAPFPEADESLIDDSLSAHVEASLRLVSLARAARKESRLKVRQPLAELVVVPGDGTERKAVELFRDHFLEELNVKRVTLQESADDLVTVTVEPNAKTIGPKFGRHTAEAREAIGRLDGKSVEQSLQVGERVTITIDGNETPIDPDDVTIKRSYGDDWAGAADGQTVVLLDKRLTPELANEGLARDIVRNVQNLRKEAGLEIDDRIRVGLVTESASLRSAIGAFGDYIRAETLAIEITPEPLGQTATRKDVKIGGEPLGLALTKA